VASPTPRRGETPHCHSVRRDRCRPCAQLFEQHVHGNAKLAGNTRGAITLHAKSFDGVPTVALDARSEFEVFQRFLDLSCKRSTHSLAHSPTAKESLNKSPAGCFDGHSYFWRG
jgi:hypothetical protein